jgi:hypothetical protein
MSLEGDFPAQIGSILLGRERLLLGAAEQGLKSRAVEPSTGLLGAFLGRALGGAQGRKMLLPEAGVGGWRGQMDWAPGILRLGKGEGGVGKRRIGFDWDFLWRGERDRNVGNGRRKDIHGRRKERAATSTKK